MRKNLLHRKVKTIEFICALCGTVNEVPRKQFDDGRYGRCKNDNCYASNCGY